MSNTINTCPICGTDSLAKVNKHTYENEYDCKVCGYFVFQNYTPTLSISDVPDDNDKLASFLCYNGRIKSETEHKRINYYIGDKNSYDKIIEKNPSIFHATKQAVDNWYPKTFNEKINLILLGLAQRSTVLGEMIYLPKEAMASSLFLKRYNENGKELPCDDFTTQLNFISDYLENNNLASISSNPVGALKYMNLTLSPQGWQRVDELQKSIAENSKNVFIAMSFDPKMKSVKEAIKNAIIECGYIPRIMNEIQHNNQIVPEMLYEIKKSRFLIAELTNHNNGAYYEAGYALGFGKDVIHVCKSKTFEDDGHFDVKQVNTILWNNEDDLQEKLIKRIKATIE